MQWGKNWSKAAASCRHAQATVPEKTVTPEDTETQGARQDLEEYKAAKRKQKAMNRRLQMVEVCSVVTCVLGWRYVPW